MKRVLLTAALTLALAGSAEATAIEGGTRFPYQRWADQAKVPTPDVTLQVVAGIDGRCDPRASGCTVPAEGTIWLADRPGWLTRFVFLHELGHNYFYATGAEDTERLADDYAYCAIGLRRARAAGLGSPDLTCYALRH